MTTTSLSEEFEQISLETAESFDQSLEDFVYFVRSGDLDELDQFLSQHSGWNILVKEEESGNTVFHYAAANGHLEILRYLVEHMKKDQNLSQKQTDATENEPQTHFLNIQNQQGNTPLHWACVTGNLEIFKFLVEEGADPFLENCQSKNCIEEAASCGHESIVAFALEKYEQQQQQELETEE